tara:strand:- start:597 stop:806 length:210 start_codon:yes stop_codon:yes gene_type:complete
MSQTRTLSITEAEETALVNIIMYFNDMGLPDNIEHKDYETLSDKICEPAFGSITKLPIFLSFIITYYYG